MKLFIIGQIVFDFAMIAAIAMLVVVVQELLKNIQELSARIYKVWKP